MADKAEDKVVEPTPDFKDHTDDMLKSLIDNKPNEFAEFYKKL